MRKIKLKKIILYFLVFAFAAGIAYSNADEFAEAKILVNAQTPCSSLNESQLEAIGDYYMEQLHPGQAHKYMEQMMGSEGSESLRLAHIAMAERLYCNDSSGYANGMMGYGMMGAGFLGTKDYGGMMNMMWGNNYGYGMMGSYGYWSFLNFLSLLLAIGLVILVYLWIAKLGKEVFKKRK